MNKKEIRSLARHVSPRCSMCAAYACTLGEGSPATRIAWVPKKDSYYFERYFCDECDFTTTFNGRGIDVEHFKEMYGEKFPPDCEWEDLPYADLLRKALK